MKTILNFLDAIENNIKKAELQDNGRILFDNLLIDIRPEHHNYKLYWRVFVASKFERIIASYSFNSSKEDEEEGIKLAKRINGIKSHLRDYNFTAQRTAENSFFERY